MGKGHLKPWIAAFFLAWTGSVSNAVLKQSGLLKVELTLDDIDATAMGYQAFYPVMPRHFRDTCDRVRWTTADGHLLLWPWRRRQHRSARPAAPGHRRHG